MSLIIRIRASSACAYFMRLLMRTDQLNWILVSFVTFVTLATSAPAKADLVYFANGRTISIKSHRVDGETLVLTLRAGGEIVCSPTAIARIAPDEVPYPDETNVDVRLKPDTASDDRRDDRRVRRQPDATTYGEIIDKVS